MFWYMPYQWVRQVPSELCSKTCPCSDNEFRGYCRVYLRERMKCGKSWSEGGKGLSIIIACMGLGIWVLQFLWCVRPTLVGLPTVPSTGTAVKMAAVFSGFWAHEPREQLR
jgi:hypothetical protein